MTKKLWLGAFLLTILAGCVEEDIRRLQTDQSFEGEEAYLISKLLDEHLILLWQPVSFYKDSTKIAGIPGCPFVTLDTVKNEVTLRYESVDCQNLPNDQTGRIVFTYTPLPVTQGYSLTISYQKYTFQGNTFSGSRTLTIAAQNRDRRVFLDVASDVLLTAQNQSSSRVSFSLSHEVMISGDRIIQGLSTGSGNARNWAGREVTWEITVPKLFQIACTEQRQLRPSTGQELWTITRSSTSDVLHRLTYYLEPECITHTIIQLDEGVEMKKTP